MKKISAFLILAFFATSVFSQAPHSFRYQTVVRNNAGELLSNQPVGIRISILSDSPTGLVVFSETYTLITSSVGLINLSVGTGVAENGSIEDIQWGTGSYYMRIDVDKDGGNNYEFMGTSQLLSVPYALYAEKAGNGGNSESESYWQKKDNSLFYNYGNIGIGTDQPQNALSIVGDEDEWPGRIMLSIKNTSEGPKSLAYLKIYSGPGETGTALGHVSTTYTANESPEDVAGFGILASSENGMIINATKPDLSPGIIKFFNGQTSGTKFIETMRINSNGNVGIGTPTPIGKLNIVGNVDAGEERAFIRLKNYATGPSSSVSIALQAYDDKGISFAYTSRDYAYNDLSDFGVVTTSGRGIALAPNHGQIRFYTSINPDNTYSEKMRIDEQGNVGIGKSNMGGIYNPKLFIYNGWLQVADSSDHDAGIVVSHLNRTGYGYARTVQQVFEGVNGDPFTEFRIRNSSDDRTITSWSMGADNSDNDKFKVNVFSDVLTGSSPSYGSNVLTLTTEGNLGVGTQTPRARVEIADGDVYISSLNKGVIMTSPDGQCWRGTINNSGVLEFSPVVCP